MYKTTNNYMLLTRHVWGVTLTVMSYLQAAVSQPIKTLTMILSVCNVPPSIDHTALSNVLLRKPGIVSEKANLQDMFQECSNRKAKFTSTIVEQPIYIPCKGTYWAPQCEVYEWADFADNYATKTLRIPLSTYTNIMYVLPQGNLCGFGGLGSLGPCGAPCRVWISGQIPDQITAYFHELGHNLGLGHASYNNDQYGDLTDAMGYCCSIRCFAAPNSHRLGWTKAKHNLKIPFTGIREYKIVASEYIIVHDQTRSEKTFIQFRKAHNGTYDKDVSMTAVNIYTLPTTSYAVTTREGMLWINGHVWQGMTTLKVTLLSITEQSAIIRIEPITINPLALAFEHIPL